MACANTEVVITVAFLDDQGAEQYTTIRTTVASDIIQGRAGMIRQSLERHCAQLGYEILSVQARYETTHQVVAEPTQAAGRPRLWLVHANKLTAGLLLVGLYLLCEYSGREPLQAENVCVELPGSPPPLGCSRLDPL